MPDLVIVRHGQSLWNLENKFTGWIDVDLSDKGIDEAVNAAESLKNYKFDVAFSSVLKRANRTLDIKDTADRVLPYYHKVIEPELKAGKNVIISAHGNSLRALMMYLENLTKEQILETEIPTGKPILYKLDENLKVKEKIFL